MLTRKLYYFYRLRKSQYWGRARLRSFQGEMLQRLLEDTYHNNDFYRQKWDEEGFHPDMFHGLDDIDKVPYTTREEITANYPEPIMDAEKVYTRSTSGSSGREPLQVSWGEESYDYSEAVYLRALVNAGYRPWQEKAYYWYQQVLHEEAPRGRRENT
ncbi:MAG: hypothetical protein ABEJ98_00485 [Candidatus Nanohaloarchaea archaeon]